MKNILNTTNFAIIYLALLINTKVAKSASLPSLEQMKPEGAKGEIVYYIDKGIATMITVAQIAFLIMFLIGGIMYLTSAGNDDQAGKARKLMLNSVIGIVIVFAFFALGTWILEKFK